MQQQQQGEKQDPGDEQEQQHQQRQGCKTKSKNLRNTFNGRKKAYKQPQRKGASMPEGARCGRAARQEMGGVVAAVIIAAQTWATNSGAENKKVGGQEKSRREKSTNENSQKRESRINALPFHAKQQTVNF